MSRWPQKPVSLALVAADASRFRGELGPADMPRIRALVEAEASDVPHDAPSVDDIRLSAECTFKAVEEPAFVALEGSLRGTVPLLCQRCLEPVTHTVDSTFALALCKGDPPEDWLGSLAERYERWDVEGDEFDLTGCMDEFLVLELPLAAAHADRRDCGPLAQRIGAPAGDEPPVHRPFAALSALMEDKPQS